MGFSTLRLALLFVVVSALTAAGCGPTLYAVKVAKAEHAVSDARAAGAANLAPYELHYAEANLHKAREDAGEAAYQDAIRYARLARVSADRALELARAPRTGAPR